MEIQKAMRRLSSSDPMIFWKLFDSQIEPMLTYAAEVWGLGNVDQIEKVQTFAMKRFLSVPLHASNKLLYGETGRYPLFIRTALKCIKYWIRLIRLPLSRLCRQTYDMLLIQHNQGRINWVSKVQQILNENGCGIVWQCQGVGYEDRFVAEFKDRTMSCYKQNWHSNIEGNEKYKWFYTFKDSFFTERYLSFITTKRFRDTLTRFRVRACGLRSHKVWFQTEISENSSCPMCGHLLEDEVHFLFQCPAYLHLREKYVSMGSVSQPNWSNVRNIFACENEPKTINLSK